MMYVSLQFHLERVLSDEARTEVAARPGTVVSFLQQAAFVQCQLKDNTHTWTAERTGESSSVRT